MSLSCYQSLFELWFLSSLRTLFTYVQRLLHLATIAINPPPTEPLRFQPEPDAPIDLEKPYNHTRYLDPETGAFPRKALPHLPPPFGIYEEILAVVNGPLPALSLGEDKSEEAISRRPFGEKWRARVRAQPTLDLSPIKDDIPTLQRAHAVLAWLVHFYVHSTPPPPNKEIVVPASIARPLVQVSQWLKIAPVLTYADTVLWNFELQDENKPFTANNMTFTTLFNMGNEASRDESEFYRCCAWIEQRGFDCTKLITSLVEDLEAPPRSNDLDKADYHELIAHHLRGLAPVVYDMTDILMSVKNSCRPNAFYSAVRPWYRGSDTEGDGLRWVYEGVEDTGSLELSGPSAGQTSTFHVLDALLGVEHNDKSRPFMERTLQYMPAEQRALLRHLQATSPLLTSLVAESEVVKAAYNAVLDAMARFRTDHLQVAVRYVVSPKDKCPITGLGGAMGKAGCPAQQRKSRGTGGNELSTMLKGSRDSTKDARKL